MTDRELLEKAAKAAGYGDVWYLEGSGTPYVGPRYQLGSPVAYRTFQPLTDDGDALRLAVKLRLDLQFSEAAPQHSHPRATAWVGTPLRFDEFVREDAPAAARRAIVRAAAALAKAQ
jgi:hypothetical protein